MAACWTLPGVALLKNPPIVLNTSRPPQPHRLPLTPPLNSPTEQSTLEAGSGESFLAKDHLTAWEVPSSRLWTGVAEPSATQQSDAGHCGKSCYSVLPVSQGHHTHLSWWTHIDKSRFWWAHRLCPKWRSRWTHRTLHVWRTHWVTGPRVYVKADSPADVHLAAPGIVSRISEWRNMDGKEAHNQVIAQLHKLVCVRQFVVRWFSVHVCVYMCVCKDVGVIRRGRGITLATGF